jgi:hypothetical protein
MRHFLYSLIVVAFLLPSSVLSFNCDFADCFVCVVSSLSAIDIVATESCYGFISLLRTLRLYIPLNIYPILLIVVALSKHYVLLAGREHSRNIRA